MMLCNALRNWGEVNTLTNFFFLSHIHIPFCKGCIQYCLFIPYLQQFGEESQEQEEEEGGGALYASVDDEPPLVEEQEQYVSDNTADGQVNWSFLSVYPS